MKQNKRFDIIYSVFIILLCAFGLYKSGLYLYAKDLIKLNKVFNPLLIVIVSTMGSLTGSQLKKEGKQKLKTLLKNDYDAIIEALVLSCVLPLNSNLIVVFVVSFLMPYIKKFNINKIALSYSSIEIIDNIIDFGSKQTLLDNSNLLYLFKSGTNLNYSTSMIIIISLIIFSFSKHYKKDTAISSVLSYLLVNLGFSGATGDISNLTNMFENNYLFSFIYILPLTKSKRSRKRMIKKGVFVALLTFILSFYIKDASMISILLASIVSGLIDKKRP